MILTQGEKVFITTNQEPLKRLFEKRIEELKNLAADLPRGEKRDATIDLIQEFRIWLKDINNASKPEKERPDNII